MVQPPGKALVFPAEHTFWVRALALSQRCGDGFGVFFRFGEVYGDIQETIGGFGSPLDVLGDAVPADIIDISAELVIPGGRFLGRLLIFLPELRDYR